MAFTVKDIERAIGDRDELRAEWEKDDDERWEEEEDSFGSALEETSWSKESVVELPDIGPTKYVAGKVGREGGGEEIWIVFSAGDQLFKITGYYSSYDGSNWDEGEISEVKAVEKTIIVYEDIPVR